MNKIHGFFFNLFFKNLYVNQQTGDVKDKEGKVIGKIVDNKINLFYSLITLFTLLMVSCGPDDTVTIPKEEYQKLKGDTIKPEYPREVYWINSLNSYGNNQIAKVIKIENHEYLIGEGYGSTHSFFLIHYPDCKFCKKDTLK